MTKAKWKHDERIMALITETPQELTPKEWLDQFLHIFTPDPEVLAEDVPEGRAETITFSATYFNHICGKLKEVSKELEA